MLTRNIELSLSTYEALLHKYELGEPHVTLVGGGGWYGDGETQSVEKQAENELRDLKLLGRNGLDSDFLDTLEVLQRPQREYYTWANVEGTQFSLRAAIFHQEAVIVVSDRRSLLLCPSDPDALLFDFVRQLPDVPPAKLSSASCPVEEFRSLVA